MTRRFIVILSVFILFANTGCKKETTTELLSNAVEKIKQDGYFEEALVLIDKALRKDPKNLEAMLLKGHCLRELRRKEECLEILSAAAQKAPENFQAQYYYGWALCEYGQYGEAVQYLKKSEKLNPDDLNTLILLSNACIKQNLYEEGSRSLNRLLEHPAFSRHPAPVYNSLAILALNRQNLSESWRWFLRAYAKDPQNPVYLQNLAVIKDKHKNEPGPALRYYDLCRSAAKDIADDATVIKVERRMKELQQRR